jgi:hypothetical protein
VTGTAGLNLAPAPQEGSADKNQRPDRRLPSYTENCGQKETVPEVRIFFPGRGSCFEQFMRELEKNSHEPAQKDHQETENPRKPGRDFFREPKAPEFPGHSRAGVLEHGYSYGEERHDRIYIGLMVRVRATGFPKRDQNVCGRSLFFPENLLTGPGPESPDRPGGREQKQYLTRTGRGIFSCAGTTNPKGKGKINP